MSIEVISVGGGGVSVLKLRVLSPDRASAPNHMVSEIPALGSHQALQSYGGREGALVWALDCTAPKVSDLHRNGHSASNDDNPCVAVFWGWQFQ